MLRFITPALFLAVFFPQLASALVIDARATAQNFVNTIAGEPDDHTQSGAGVDAQVNARRNYQFASPVNDVVYDLKADSFASSDFVEHTYGLTVSAYANAFALGPRSGATASAHATASDTLHCNPGFLQRVGHKKLVFTIYTHVTGSATQSGYDAANGLYTSSTAQYGLSINGKQIKSDEALAGGTSTPVDFREKGDSLAVQLDAGYLDEFNNVEVSMTATATATVSTTDYKKAGQATADFGSTFIWQGVAAIHDEFGNSISMEGFTLLNDDGRDFGTVTPEPTSVSLLLAGGLTLMRRPKRSVV